MNFMYWSYFWLSDRDLIAIAEDNYFFKVEQNLLDWYLCGTWGGTPVHHLQITVSYTLYLYTVLNFLQF